MDLPKLENRFQQDHVTLLLDSYRRWLGRDLMAGDETGSIARRLFEAPFVVVSHNVTDPLFNYGNLAALKLFEMNWRDFTTLPSRKSAEPMNREERARLLATVAKDNFIDDYSGVRISATGKRFFIPKAIVWNVIDERGTYHGQAATFSEWQYI